VLVQVENLHPRQGNEPQVCRKWPQVFNLRFPAARPLTHRLGDDRHQPGGDDLRQRFEIP
jgi:hypothetical protein